MASNYTSEEITLQEEKHEAMQEYYNSIGLELKETTALLSDDIAKNIYRKLVQLLPNLLASDEYILAILSQSIADFKYYCKKLEHYRKTDNLEAYIAIQKVKNTTSGTILSMLKSLCLTNDTRKNLNVIFELEE